MAFVQGTLAVPGQLLGPATLYQPGEGTHIHGTNVYASLLGVVAVTQPPKPPGPVKRPSRIIPTASASSELRTVSVSRKLTAAQSVASGGDAKGKRETLPDVGSIVLCRVTRIAARQATVSILTCGDTVVEAAEWQAVIRVQDVRATEKDRVKIAESFRPGDIVMAEVVRDVDLASLLSMLTDSYYRSLSVIRQTTTSLLQRTSLALSWPLARPATRCTR
jgi:exosome complex component CSL4